MRAKRMALRRRYKIQDVIHRRQVLLVQVVKEERGNKGAALTTYLSLAGRYCVLMPNSTHGGGISRKISNAADRKRLKQIVAELKLPKAMGCIVRTAGLQRNKTEIKRDFDYLARLWDEIRENTLKSSAPALIHSDSDLVKRAIRDIYNREIEEVVVEGEDGYKAARDFMKLLMPSHARRVKALFGPGATVPALWRGRSADGDVRSGRPAQIGRLSGDQPDRGAGLDRHQLGPFDQGARDRADRAQHQYGSRAGNRPPVAPARHGRAGGDRLHRHGIQLQRPQGRTGDEGRAQARPRPDPGRPHLGLRPDGNEPPAPAHRRARSDHPLLPALRWHRAGPHGLQRRPFGAAPDRGRSGQGQGHDHHALCQHRSGGLSAQCQARRSRPRSRSAMA